MANLQKEIAALKHQIQQGRGLSIKSVVKSMENTYYLGKTKPRYADNLSTIEFKGIGDTTKIEVDIEKVEKDKEYLRIRVMRDNTEVNKGYLILNEDIYNELEEIRDSIKL